ncbi:hypothetical protein H0H93_003491 [Arthromyces matolae]|nr:hypothetical protein H0H93_003491 [Arthromyces matolae]
MTTIPPVRDSNSSLKTQLASSSNVAYPKDLTFEDWHQRLLKDVPLDPELGVFCVEVSGPYPVYIRVGNTHLDGLDFNDPVGGLRSMARRQQMHYPGDDLKVLAEFVPLHWSLEEGFHRLGEFLACLGQMEVPFERWGQLDILLPDIELPYDTMSPPLLPLDSFSNLKLIWRGHRKQLLVSWLPFTPNLLRTLTVLDIQCDVSLQDCCHMLYYGESLVEFTLRIIQRSLASENILDFVSPPGCVTRPLEYLCLVSDDDITPLLSLFHFPFLQQIHFTLGHPTFSTFSDWTIWKTLKRVFLKTYRITPSAISWIKSQCDPAADCNFPSKIRPAKGASSFLNSPYTGSKAPFLGSSRDEHGPYYQKA